LNRGMADDEEGEADGLMPEGAVEWDQLLELPIRFLPWPYTLVELDRMWDALPAPGAALATRTAIFAARWFLADARLKQNFGVSPKADPRSELNRIVRASRELGDAICAASNETFEHFSSQLSPLAAKPPVRAHDLLSYLFWFEHDNRFAFRNLPEHDRIGAPEKTRDEDLIYRLWKAWRYAHAERPPVRGWPIFRAACLDPLADAKFPNELRLAPRLERGWQALLARARARFEGARN
jgi:hypothetical protein